MWALLCLNAAIRWDERRDPRVLIGEPLLDAIKRRWVPVKE